MGDRRGGRRIERLLMCLVICRHGDQGCDTADDSAELISREQATGDAKSADEKEDVL
jgi:hypothetical protein